MMKPLYFPNVYVNEEISEALKGQFDQISVYGVANRDIQAEALKSDADDYETLILDYGDEDQFHDFLLTCCSSKPLYNPNRAFQLTAELQDRIDGVTPQNDSASSEKDCLMKARLFLQMAYEYDMQSRTIHRELQACKRKERELLIKLHGFDGDDNPRFEETDCYSSDFQVEKRFEYWAVIFEKSLEEQGKSGDGLFITDIRALIETIIEFEPDVEFVCEMPLDLNEDSSLSDFAERLTNCDWPSEKDSFKSTDSYSGDRRKRMIRFYILPEKEPGELFRKFATGKKSNEKRKTQVESPRNTVLGYIQI